MIVYLKDKGVKIEFGAMSLTILLSKYKEISKDKNDGSIYVYYIFIYLVVSLVLVFVLGMISGLVHDILAPAP
jgi:hypothetical protein